MENANIIYGKLIANLDITGYCHENAMGELKFLLQEDRWKEVGKGYDNINDFVRSLANYWSTWRITAEQRKEISKLLQEAEASQRATAKMLGVDEKTIRNDTAEKSAPDEDMDIDYQDVAEEAAEKSAPTLSSGEKLVKQQAKEHEKELKKQQKEREKELKKEAADKIDEIQVEVIKNVKYGDKIKLGNHILHCFNAYELDIKADAIITDPPYGINYEPNWKKWDGTESDFKKITGDTEQFKPEMFLKYKTMLFFGANYFSNHLPIGGWLVWDKRTDEVKDRMIGSPIELAWFVSQHTERRLIIKRFLHGGVVNADSEKGNNEKRHVPTQKPISLMQSIIEDLTVEGETITDPFAGSGSTLLACELSNRKCYAVEVEPENCSIIITRWEKATGEKAIWM